MSSLIPFAPEPDSNRNAGQAAGPAASDGTGAAGCQPWTPEGAKLRDLDASGVTASLPKLLAARAAHGGVGAEHEDPPTEAYGLAGVPGRGVKVGDRLVLIGGAPNQLGESLFIEAIHGLHTEPRPKPDACSHAKLIGAVATLARAGILCAGSPLRAGGLLVTAAEMLMEAGPELGLKVDLTAFGSTRSDALLFGEDVDRVVVAVSAERVGTVLSESHTDGVPAAVIGEVIGQPELALFTRRLSATWTVACLREAHGGGT